jgi:hypothetical protein
VAVAGAGIAVGVAAGAFISKFLGRNRQNPTRPPRGFDFSGHLKCALKLLLLGLDAWLAGGPIVGLLMIGSWLMAGEDQWAVACRDSRLGKR